MTLDKGTGLPELPEGFFWRIEDMFHMNSSGVIVPALTVEICTKKWFRTRIVMENDLTETHSIGFSDYASPPGEGWVSFDAYYYRRALPPTTENVLLHAQKLHKKFIKTQEEKRKVSLESEARQKLAGTYPPKKLNL